ncbi:MAG: DUF559 domain-containing protein [Fidelibacterota bacterium]|nr:MAG: DUF559 domain-containing protein [Candidatus Neomarinimicrobiota bacterium]
MKRLPDTPQLPFQEHYRYKSIRVIAGLLRKHMTPSEQRLWHAIRKRQLSGLKFLRQHPIGVSVVDFYCHEKRLAVEIDGGIHLRGDVKERDQYRQELIESYGIRFFRCTSDEIETDLEGVLGRLKELVAAR